MRQLEQEGTFKARAFDWNVRAFPSGSVAVVIQFEVVAEKTAAGWVDCSLTEEPRSVVGNFFVTLRTGAANEKQVENLCVVMGWGGSVRNLGPVPTHIVQVVVEAETYKEKKYWKVKWLNEENRNADKQAKAPSGTELDRLDEALAAVAAKFQKKLPKGVESITVKRVQPPVEPAKQNEDYGSIPF